MMMSRPCTCPVCLMGPEDAEEERRWLVGAAMAALTGRGMGDYEARMHLITHAVNYPEMIQ